MLSRVGVCDLLPYSNWTVFSKSGQNHVVFGLKMAQNECLSDFSPNYVLPFPNIVFNIISNTLKL